jgi:cytochrome c556
MAAHASDMGALVSAILALDWERIEQHAKAIAEEPHFAHPLNADATELRPALPETFFSHDRALRVMAAALASGARERNGFLVANAYGQMSQACVSCHATYRSGRPGEKR